jgi:hypothetical protein
LNEPLAWQNFTKVIDPRASPTFLSCEQFEPEAHVIAEPHNIIRSPGIVKEVEVEALGKVRLVSRKVPRVLPAQRNYRRILRLDA